MHASYDAGLWFEGYKVVYLPEEQEAFLHKLLEYVLQVWQQESDDFIIRVFLNYLNSVRFAFKHSAFEPEQELRFVIKMDKRFYRTVELSEKDADKLIKFYDRDGIIVPYIEVPFGKEDIKAIKLSPLIKEENAIESVSLLLDKLGYKRDIQIDRSDIPLRY